MPPVLLRRVKQLAPKVETESPVPSGLEELEASRSWNTTQRPPSINKKIDLIFRDISHWISSERKMRLTSSEIYMMTERQQHKEYTQILSAFSSGKEGNRTGEPAWLLMMYSFLSDCQGRGEIPQKTCFLQEVKSPEAETKQMSAPYWEQL